MEHLGDIFRQQGGAGVHLSAAMVAAANEHLESTLRLQPNQARAISVQQQTLLIEVEHGALSGLLKRQEEDFLDRLNNVIRQRFGASTPAILHLSIRVR